MRTLHLPFVFLLLLLSATGWAQRFDLDNPKSFVLSDSMEVVVLNPLDYPLQFYYMPVNLRLSQKEDGFPELSFMGIKEGDGPKLKGGIMHFLLTWGLDNKQQEELDSIIKEIIDPEAALWGAVPLSESQTEVYPVFYSEEDSKYLDYLQEYQRRQARVPVFPGGKWATSYYFKNEAAEEMEKVMKSPDLWKDARVRFYWHFDAAGTDIHLEKKLKDLFNIQPTKP